MTSADNPEKTVPTRLIASIMPNVVTPLHPATTETATEPKKEIIRCLKRYVAREVYRHLRAIG